MYPLTGVIWSELRMPFSPSTTWHHVQPVRYMHALALTQRPYPQYLHLQLQSSLIVNVISIVIPTVVVMSAC